MTSPAEAFAYLRSALESAGVRYAIGGSWASTAFGEARFTNDVDIVADLTPENVEHVLARLPTSFYSEPEEAREAIARGRPFNIIHVPTAFKFDLFPARAFSLGMDELDRAIFLPATGLSELPLPFVTPEDILLAKLHWYSLGGNVSDVQWRDIRGIVLNRASHLDRAYLEQGADKLGVRELLERALTEI